MQMQVSFHVAVLGRFVPGYRDHSEGGGKSQTVIIYTRSPKAFPVQNINISYLMTSILWLFCLDIFRS
jgi:hypothetical protein